MNHLRIDYDDVTIGKNSAEKLYVKNGGITSLQIAEESITRGDLFGELLADFDDASTLGGRGPSDFAPAYGSGRYIQNQKNSVQTAGFSKSGNALIGGNIGVGAISPLYNLGVNGSFRATSKSFNIPNPLDPEHKRLVHGCLEGPELAVYYHGEGRIKNGVTVVEIPEYFDVLTRSEGRTIQVTPIFKMKASP